jgi:hypothetical protein
MDTPIPRDRAAYQELTRIAYDRLALHNKAAKQAKPVWWRNWIPGMGAEYRRQNTNFSYHRRQANEFRHLAYDIEGCTCDSDYHIELGDLLYIKTPCPELAADLKRALAYDGDGADIV